MKNDHLHVYISANLAVIPQGRLCPPKEGALVVLIVIWELDVQKFKYIEVYT